MGVMGRNGVRHGEKYGKLTAVCIQPKDPTYAGRKWLFACDCGGSTEVRSDGVKQGRVLSCGCAKIGVNRKKKGEASFRRFFEQSKLAASKRAIEWNLSEDEHKEIVQKNCYYCGASPRNFNPYFNKKAPLGRRKEISKETFDLSWVCANGVDRVKNNVGYIPENVVPCCKACNYSKWSRTAEDFINHAISIAIYQHKRGTDV